MRSREEDDPGLQLLSLPCCSGAGLPEYLTHTRSRSTNPTVKQLQEAFWDPSREGGRAGWVKAVMTHFWGREELPNPTLVSDSKGGCFCIESVQIAKPV